MSIACLDKMRLRPDRAVNSTLATWGGHLQVGVVEFTALLPVRAGAASRAGLAAVSRGYPSAWLC